MSTLERNRHKAPPGNLRSNTTQTVGTGGTRNARQTAQQNSATGRGQRVVRESNPLTLGSQPSLATV